MDLTEGLEALLRVEDDEQLAQALNEHPELLSADAIQALQARALDAGRAGHHDAAAYLEALADFLARLSGGAEEADAQESLAEALDALAGVETPAGLQRTFVEYPELLQAETIALLMERAQAARRASEPEAAERWEGIADFLRHARSLLGTEEEPPAPHE